MPDPNVKAITTAVNLTATSYVLDISNTKLNDIASITVPVGSPSDNRLLIDSSDFASRYISLDAISDKQDGSDIGYMRVLRFNNGKFGSQVFPITSSGIKYKYKDFIITTVGSNLIEKAQILKTNNTLQIYAFDSQVEVLTIQGVLKSTIQDNWDMGMVVLWEELFRLTKLIQMNLIVEMGYQSSVYWGFPLNFNWQKSSNIQALVSYSMQFIVVKKTSLAKNSNQLTLANDISRQIQNIPNIV